MSNYIPGTPSTLAQLGATGVRRVAYEAKLRRDSVRPSVFESLKSAIKMVDSMVSIVKSGIFMEINTPPDSGQSCVVSMRTPLKKAPQYGNANNVLGNEDEQSLVFTQLYYNEIKKGVKYQKWGYDYNDTKYLNYIETNGAAIVDFMAENRDVRIHQALTTGIGEELTYAPVSLTPKFNKNWIIPNLLESSAPAWDKDTITTTAGAADADGYYSSRTYSGATTFIENIAAALLAASGTGSTSKALMTNGFLSDLSYRLPNSLIMPPVMLDGVPTYVILTAARVAAWMKNPDNTGSLGKYWQNVKEYKSDDRLAIPGELGRCYGNLVFVENSRAPTLTVGGSAGSYTLAVGYMQPGNNDDRNNSAWSNNSGSTNYVFDLCYALGAEALAEYIVDPLNSNLFETTEFTKIEARACYVGSGIQIPAWDKDAASQLDGASVTQIQRTSAIIPVSRTAINALV